ncbi:hypothetical protein HJFPF1_04788 [Paramyrothecium foliicola]|nr:hypothetical protein HJFPF1_04788 [Paramyrothecium foliicola]
MPVPEDSGSSRMLGAAGVKSALARLLFPTILACTAAPGYGALCLAGPGTPPSSFGRSGKDLLFPQF